MQIFTGLGQIGQIGESGAQGLAAVAITRNQEQRCLQAGQNLAQMRIFVRLGLVHAVAGMNNRVHTLPVYVGDTRLQVLGAALARGLIRRAREDVRITDLRDDHFISLRSGPVPGGGSIAIWRTPAGPFIPAKSGRHAIWR